MFVQGQNQDSAASTKSEITNISKIVSIKTPRELCTKRIKGSVREGIVGLRNNSLYCYMNACL